MTLNITQNVPILLGHPSKHEAHKYKQLFRIADIGTTRFSVVHEFDEALKLLKQTAEKERPALVFLDTQFLPNGLSSCYSLISQIRQHFNGTVLISVVGDVNKDAARKVKSLGANAYIIRGKINEFRQRLLEFKEQFIVPDRSSKEFKVIL